MTDQEQPKFTIKRLSPEEARRSRERGRQKPVEQKPPEPKPTPKPAPEPMKKTTAKKPVPRTGVATGGCFRSAGGVLAFLGSALGTGLIDEAAVRRMPQGGWWAEVPVGHQRISPLVWTAGGRPYAVHKGRWVALSLSGDLPGEDEEPQFLDVESWPVEELAALLAETNLMPNRYAGVPQLGVLVPGSLGRWVLRRASSLGLNVTITPVMRSPLGAGKDDESGALLIRLETADPQQNIPAALVHSLTRLPHIIAADPVGSDNLLIDVRCRMPLPANVLSGMVPGSEIWVLSPGETGDWCLRTAGEEVDGASLLDAPEISITDISVDTNADLPGTIPVQLVSRPTAKARVDAVLIDDSELEWLSSYLRGHRLGEISFLLPGSGCHLLTSPGGLPGGGVPFGIPLTRIGPGGLYLEMGMDFYPPLPDGARRARFQLNKDSAVVMVQKAAYRFSIDNIVPAWTLWVGEAPEVREGLTRDSEMFLTRISEAIRRSETKREEPRPQEPKQPVTRSERIQLLEQAQRAELSGNSLQAAELLEKAGSPGPAGRLYERAARGA